MLASNAIFVDCHYINKDLYDILFKGALVLREHNYGLFLLARQRLNEMLVYMRDDLDMCDYVPEIDIVFKDQYAIYSQPFEDANAELRDLEGSLQLALKTGLDGRRHETQFTMMMPTLKNLQGQTAMTQMMRAVNALLLIQMLLLSGTVLYSIMLSDVNEQTY